MYQPSDTSLQDTTWSQYYNMNCAKGGVPLQLCGWMWADSLSTRVVSDSVYQSKCSIFNEQSEFSRIDTQVGEDVISFKNVYDKGYRCTEYAYCEVK